MLAQPFVRWNDGRDDVSGLEDKQSIGQRLGSKKKSFANRPFGRVELWTDKLYSIFSCIRKITKNDGRLCLLDNGLPSSQKIRQWVMLWSTSENLRALLFTEYGRGIRIIGRVWDPFDEMGKVEEQTGIVDLHLNVST